MDLRLARRHRTLGAGDFVCVLPFLVQLVLLLPGHIGTDDESSGGFARRAFSFRADLLVDDLGFGTVGRIAVLVGPVAFDLLLFVDGYVLLDLVGLGVQLGDERMRWARPDATLAFRSSVATWNSSRNTYAHLARILMMNLIFWVCRLVNDPGKTSGAGDSARCGIRPTGSACPGG